VLGALWEATRRAFAKLTRREDPGPFDPIKLMPLTYVVAGAFILMSVILIAADIIKRAMIQLDQKLQNDPDIAMIMQVHDELVFEVRSEKIAFYSELIKTQMESAADLVVPLIVDVGQGTNWDEAH